MGSPEPPLRIQRRILNAAQARALRRLGPPLSERSFYLAGGTALALQLGHRRSVDLDWFTDQPLEDPLRLARELVDESVPLVVDGVERGTLHATLSGVRVTLIEYRYPLLRRVVPWPASHVRLASLEDIACMKLAAVAQRGARKDFLDIYAVGRRVPLRTMLRLYRRKYRIQDYGHVLFALTYFDDAEREPMPRVLVSRPWAEIKQAIRGWVAEIAG